MPSESVSTSEIAIAEPGKGEQVGASGPPTESSASPPPKKFAGIIYRITRNVSGLPPKHYVGQTIGPLWRRWKQHRQKHGGPNNRVLYAAIKKWGRDAFEVIELEKVEKLEDLNAKELYWGIHYQTLVPTGYNLKLGNGHDLVVSRETREKLRQGTAKRWEPGPEREKTLAALRIATRNPEYRAYKSRQTTQSWKVQDVKNRRLEGLRRVMNTPEMRAMRSAQMTPEARANLSSKIAALWTNPDYVARQKKSRGSIRRSRQSVQRQSEEQGRRQRQAQQRPKLKAIHSRVMTEIWADPKRSEPMRRAISAGRTRFFADPINRVRQREWVNAPGVQRRRIATLRSSGRFEEITAKRAAGVRRFWANATPEQRAERGRKSREGRLKKILGRKSERSIGS